MSVFFSGLRIRLMLLVLLAVVPALGLILNSGLEQRRQAIVDAENQASQFLMHVSLYQDRLIEGTIQLLDTLAQMPQLRERDAQKCSETFAAIMRKHTQYHNIGAIGMDGFIFASGLHLEKPIYVGDRRYFQQTIRHNGLAISDYLLSRVTGAPTLITANPIHDATGEMQGVVYTSLNIDSLASQAARESLPAHSAITITDSWGTVLYSNPSFEKALGKPFANAESIGMACAQGRGMLRVRGPNGESLLHLYHPISNLAPVGYVFVELDQKSILVGPDRILKRNLIGLGVAAVFAILVSWLFGAVLVTKKMRSLGEAARHLSEGDLTVRTGVTGGTGEIDQLAISFDKMAEALQKRDVQRRQAETALLASEEKYRLIVETANEGIWVVDEHHITTFVNSVMAAMIGYEPREILGRPFAEFIFAQDIPDHELDLLQRSQGNGGGYERRLRYKDGRDVWTLVSATPMFDNAHVFIGSFGMFTDITDRKLSEIAIRENQKQFEALFQFAPEAIFLEKLSGEIVDCNKAAEKMTGYTREELLGMSITRLVPKEELAQLARVAREVLSRGEFSVEALNVRKNGDVFPVHVSTKCVELNGEKTLIVIVHDLSERKRMELDLLKVEKLESLGVLAGGIAHDFNNILTAVVGNLSLARMLTKPEDPIYKRLDEAEKASMRAKDLTFQLLTFSKGGSPVRELVSLPEIISETCEFCLRGANVKCGFDLPGDLWLVKADPGQISQVMHNIMINAKQAMPDGGEVKVSARNITVDENSRLPVGAGYYVRISIEDHGAGISAEHLSKIFDPYFTTKKDGTGLGLASSYSIVHRHDGYIAAESRAGAGTTFHVYLPASLEKRVRLSQPEELPSSRHGRILLVDDEESIREVGEAMLAQLGYEGTCAAEGASAIELFKKAQANGAPFDAVILDLTIPGGLGGKETIKHLIKIDADIKAIVSSGYSNDPVMANYEDYGFCGVVSKPYRMKELGEVLKKALK